MLSKAMVMITYGKIAYYLTPENPYYKGILQLLWSQSKSENILIAEPAIYGLCNFALAHNEIVRLPCFAAAKMSLQWTPD
jgi:hypothetical protein